VGSDGKARVWNLDDFAEAKAIDLGAGKLHAVAFSPDGKTGAAGADGGKVVLWDANL
jgi:WD40 repeat protein